MSFLVEKKRHFPFIPHVLHWVDLRAQENEIPMGWEGYMLWNAPWLDDCDALFLLVESKEALLEYEPAKEEGKVLFHSMDEISSVLRETSWTDKHT